MGALEERARQFAAQHGLSQVRFYKKWHKFDVYTATREGDSESPLFFLLDEDEIRLATSSESERFMQGHNVRNDMP